MPTAAEPLLLDTSAAVPLVLADHEAHDATTAALSGRELGLAGHAAFETWSVLTRLPGTRRLSPAAAGRLLAADFAHSRHLGAQQAAALLAALPSPRAQPIGKQRPLPTAASPRRAPVVKLTPGADLAYIVSSGSST